MNWHSRHRRRNVSKLDKLKAIQAFLNGDVLTGTPQSYTVLSYEEDEYVITKTTTGEHLGKKLTEQEYEAWKETLSEKDELFCVLFRSMAGNDPLIEDDQDVTRNETLALSYPIEQRTVQSNTIEPEARNQPVNGLKREAVEDVEEVVLVSVPKRSGKLSDYGDTWDVKHTDIFYS